MSNIDKAYSDTYTLKKHNNSDNTSLLKCKIKVKAWDIFFNIFYMLTVILCISLQWLICTLSYRYIFNEYNDIKMYEHILIAIAMVCYFILINMLCHYILRYIRRNQIGINELKIMINDIDKLDKLHKS